MPAPLRDFIDIPSQPAVRVALEPANSAVRSLMLLGKDEPAYGLADWVNETVQKMSDEEVQTNQLVVFGFHYAIQPTEEWPSFPVFVDHLARMDPVALRDKMLDFYNRMPVLEPREGEQPTNLAAALESPEGYLSFLRERFNPESIDEEVELRAYQYVIDPPAMRQLVVDHFWRMWRKYLKAEWERARPILQETVRAYQPLDFSRMSFQDAFRSVTGRDQVEEKWQRMLGSARRVVFVPHPHIGPYLMKSYGIDETLYVFFGPHPPGGFGEAASDLSRTEIVVRMNALADDTRLRILRYIGVNGEQRSQEVMEALDLSQSAASRHLTQLSATGYLKERRCEGAKCYALNPERIRETLNAVSSFLLVRERSEI